jgi:hypothetical protein
VTEGRLEDRGVKDREMPTSDKDLLAAEAMDRWEDFQEGLSSEKRKYPIQQFREFWSAATRYAELTKSDSMIHKRLAAAVNGLVDFHAAHVWNCCLTAGIARILPRFGYSDVGG